MERDFRQRGVTQAFSTTGLTSVEEDAGRVSGGAMVQFVMIGGAPGMTCDEEAVAGMSDCFCLFSSIRRMSITTICLIQE